MKINMHETSKVNYVLSIYVNIFSITLLTQEYLFQFVKN